MINIGCEVTVSRGEALIPVQKWSKRRETYSPRERVSTNAFARCLARDLNSLVVGRKAQRLYYKRARKERARERVIECQFEPIVIVIAGVNSPGDPYANPGRA